jgi:2-dehydro-3-deoxyphosphogluconate aldolase / (4S)-4-hydroxy-2-oxoglutarate aldolase
MTSGATLVRPTLPRAVVDTGVIAVLRAPTPEDYLPVCRVLVDAGVTAIELTLTTPGTIAALPALRSAIPEAAFGIGTVTTVEEVEAAHAAGAELLVTPVSRPEVVAAAVERGMPIVPGGLTPTELHGSWVGAASAVKLFPAAAVGPGYLRQLAGPFPDLAVIPSGGVGIEDISAWISAGAVAVSLGGPLVGDAFRGGDLAALAARAARSLAAVAGARA